jgi:hypothetical protein
VTEKPRQDGLSRIETRRTVTRSENPALSGESVGDLENDTSVLIKERK